MNVVLVGALDTKHAEYGFVRDRITAAGVPCLVVDTSVLGTPGIAADVDRRAVAQAAGADHEALADAGDRNAAVAAMARGAAAVVRDLHRAGRVAAVVVLGGSNAGFVMSEVAPVLPLGVPKVLVSTVVAGDTRPYVGTSDVTMIYPVVDVAGLNSVSTPVLAKAADAVVGMVTGPPVPARADRPVVGATMFGVTTACVQAVSEHLAANGAEVQVFHCTGTGGRTFESLIASGLFAAVADITTTELADELVGGVCTAGPHRLEAAAAHGVPQVVSVGALDMVNFGPRDTVPAEHTGRHLIAHNPSVTLMRTSPAENAELGRMIARKLAGARAFVEVHVPRRGFSQISAPGGPFHDPDADAALIGALRAELDPRIPLHVHDLAINDPAFARHIGAALARALRSTTSTPRTKGT
ncbi:MAG TPA: Tm-1-like ATP-binding domain-containing protein [Pseudonocardia sp.]|uniref:Tm-1-like ATP-binding domain-containing protein n=1 Tax=Pseudonocardia sp. TaxID=60912 RepID=UPI002B4AB0E1|nr:Tm-1-like ATP-binding domain-containing protein [Pseudonocardia sp.]HLU57445.1 Tm-1-like ATP-binding domain-containing protein [Pseudonocardia sp.]